MRLLVTVGNWKRTGPVEPALDLAVALAEVRQLDRAACRRRVAEEFSIERMAANYVRAYEARIERVAGRPEVTA